MSVTYFKILSGGEAVDAGLMWLQWNTRHGCLMACEPSAAHYAQSRDGSTVYRFGWLNPLPAGAPVYPTVEAKIIDFSEYDDITAALDGGETVPESDDPEPDPSPEPEPEPTPDPTRPMTVQEMREKIAELTALVMNGPVPFTAEKSYQQGDVIEKGQHVYIAGQTIVPGETVAPGINCTETTVADVLNAIQTQI